MSKLNRQLSADIEIKDQNIKTSFLISEGPKARTNKTGTNIRNCYYQYSWQVFCNTKQYMIFSMAVISNPY